MSDVDEGVELIDECQGHMRLWTSYRAIELTCMLSEGHAGPCRARSDVDLFTDDDVVAQVRARRRRRLPPVGSGWWGITLALAVGLVVVLLAG